MRAAIGIVAAGTLMLSGTAHAAPKPQITDATGDYQIASADIVSGLLAVSGKGKYPTLIIRLTLAAPPVTTTPYSYVVSFKVGDCSFYAEYYGHPLDRVFSTSGVGCDDGSTSLPDGSVAVNGSAVVWSVPFDGSFKLGQKVTHLAAATEPGGAVTGTFPPPAGDAATGRDWIIK
jgi:hypothetical protein